MTTEETNVLLKDIYDRVAAMPEPMGEDKVKAIVQEVLTGLQDDPEFARKMKFGATSPSLIGSKFARWHYTEQDVEFLHEMQSSLRGQKGIDCGF